MLQTREVDARVLNLVIAADDIIIDAVSDLLYSLSLCCVVSQTSQAAMHGFTRR